MSIRADDLAKLFKPAELESMFIACGTTVTGTAEGFTDESGHPLVIVHRAAVEQAELRLTAIAALHAPDHDGFVSVCRHDGERWPCLTLRVGTE